MTGTIEHGEQTKPINTEHYFGGCPACGRSAGYMNVRSEHWFVCDVHRTKWCAGDGLFSDWTSESSRDWKRNAARLEKYEEVEPLQMSYGDEEDLS